MDKQVFNGNLRQIMDENNISQKQLSERTGIPASSIASWYGKPYVKSRTFSTSQLIIS